MEQKKCKICERMADKKKEFCDLCDRLISIIKYCTNIYKEPVA